MEQSAVGADAVHNGVTSNEFYDTFAVTTHFSRRHSLATCKDESCGHPDHGLSTAGKNFEERERAGERYDGESAGPINTRDVTRNDTRIAAGNVCEIIEAVQQHDAGEACSSPSCARCNTVDNHTLQREVKAHGGGSGGRSPRGKAGTQVCQVVGCGLTLCEHVRGAKRPGRPSSGGRSKPITFKVSADSKKALRQPGMAQLIDELGFVIQNGMTIEAARERLGATKPHAA